MMILNIATGKIKKFRNVEKLIEGYCTLPLREKLVSFVLGVKEDALDYPSMMEFMLDYSSGDSEVVNNILHMDEEGELERC